MSEPTAQPGVIDPQDPGEQVTDLIHSVRPDGSFLYVNRAWCLTLGYSRPEAAGLSVMDVIHPNSRNQWEELLHRVLQGEQVDQVETTLVTRDGQVVVVAGRVVPRCQDGQPVAAQGIFRDITELKRAEATADHYRVLLESMQRAQVQSMMNDDLRAMFVHSEGRIVFANQAAVRLLGAASKEALLGRNPLDFVHPDLHVLVRERVQTVLAGLSVPRIMEKYIRLDGSLIDTEVVKMPIVFAGKPAIQVILTDLSEFRRNQDQLRFQTLILNHIHDSVISTDLEGIITSWYPGAERMFGYTAPEALGQHIGLVYPPDELEFLHQEVIGKLKTNGHHNIIVRLMRKNGERFVAHLSLALFPDARGEVIGMVGYSLDITPMERAEARVQEGELRLAADVDAMKRLQRVSTHLSSTEGLPALLEEIVAAAIALTNADMGNIQLFDAASGTLKIAAHSGFEQPFLDFFNGVHEGEGACGTALKKGERVIVEDVTKSPIFMGKPALDVMLQAGARAVQSTLLQSRSGKLLGIFSTHYRTPRRPDERVLPLLDILARQAAILIERVEVAEALRKSEERYLSVVQDQTELICRFTPDCHLVWMNDAYARFFGKTPVEMVGRSFLQFIPENEWASVREFFASFTPDQPVRTYEHLVVDGQGQLRWQQWTNRAFFDDGGHPFEFQGVARDVTERKLAEEERRQLEAQLQSAQKMESLGVLAGGIAHDFNNLLMSILGYSDLARALMPEGSRPRKYLDEVVKGALRAAELTNQMLNYAGKGRFVLQPLNLSVLVEDMGRLLEVSISKKCVLQYQLTPHLPACEADAAQLRQIVMNLIVNASEAMGDRSGVISLSTGVMHCDRAYLSKGYLDDNLPEGSYVYLEVSDTGCGMSDETKAKLFDPFFSTKFTGRGLGLAAALGIVRSHYGAVHLYSELGKGTTFKVLFPAMTGPAQAKPDPIKAPAPWRGSGVVLIVDDEAAARELTGEMMELMGFTVLSAADGRDGVEVFRREHARLRLVLLDMSMPHLDGEETFREMRRIQTGVPTVLCSGYNEQMAMNRFTGKGLAAFIQKPFDYHQLIAVVRKALGETADPD